jgi:cobyrinic acid a,c-diamide synthase
MPVISVPRLLIGGTCSGVGKSLLMTGLTVALRKRGVSVSCCLANTDLHQGVLYQRMSRRNVRTLDQRLLDPEMIRFSLYQAGLGADIVLIDGHNGLFDGWNVLDPTGSDLKLAEITQTPIVLVTQCKEFSESAAALVYGYSNFIGQHNLGAILVNQFDGSTVDSFSSERGSFNQILQAHTLPLCLGIVPTAELSSQLPPSSFAQHTNVTSLPSQFFHELSDLVSQYIDIEGLLEVARRAPEIELPVETDPPQNRRCRIAVADDGCFSVGFQDNVDLFRYFGAEIVAFSPMADNQLPEGVSGVYLGGAYLQTYGVDLSLNTQMHDSIREFVESGGLLLSEGAGSAYLCQRFQIAPDEEMQEGVGILPFYAMLSDYHMREITVRLSEDSILGHPGTILAGVETNEFKVKGDTMLTHRPPPMVAEIEGGSRATGYANGPSQLEGYSPTSQSFCTFSFIHLGATPHIAKAIVEAAVYSPATPATAQRLR